jgi:hypothetical protein
MASKNTWRRRRLNRATTGSCTTISQNLLRNMELVILCGRTVYRPIDAGQPSFPTRTVALNKIRQRWGRSEGELVTAQLKVTIGSLTYVSFGGRHNESEAA